MGVMITQWPNVRVVLAMLGLLLAFLLVHGVSSVERSRGSLGPRIFTFVHGEESAKMDFFSADAYCKQKIGSDDNDMGAIGSIQKENDPYKFEVGKGPHENQTSTSELVLASRLASLHSHPENLALVQWITKQEQRSFWIGGTITQTLNEYLRPIFVLQWTDGSNADFSFLRLPSSELSSMRIGEKRCISVDFLSGQWGVHPCEEKRYFVCLTVPVLKYSKKEERTKPSTYKSVRSRLSTGTESSSARNEYTVDELRKLLS